MQLLQDYVIQNSKKSKKSIYSTDYVVKQYVKTFFKRLVVFVFLEHTQKFF